MLRPKISVVIPTHNRSDSLLRLLKAISANEIQEVECIVVCDACTDDTLMHLKQLIVPYSLQYLETPGMGAAYARHQGALMCKGELLVFLDDDIDPTPHMLSAFLEMVKHEKDVGIGYLVLEENDDKSWNRLYLNFWWEKHFYELEKADHVFNFQDLTSGGLCLYRHFYFQVGGFDTRFKCREDYEFGHRLLNANATFRFSRSAMGVHCDNVSDQLRLHRRKELEGFWDVEMVRKHPELWSKCFLRAIYFTRSWRRWFIWLAFYTPRFGRYFFRKMFRRQKWMERNNFRQSWLKAEARQHRFNYALGLAAQFSSLRIFNEWVEAIERDFPINDKDDKHDQLYFANQWLDQHKINGERPGLISEPLRRFLAFDYFRSVTHNQKPLPQPLPYISIVVCTRDRTENLKACLGALFELEYTAKEIIIVDNAPSSNATQQLCAHLPVTYVLESTPGLDNARNTGIEHATHDIIAFTDDDALPDKDWLKRIIPHFEDPQIMCVTGYVAPWSLQTKAERVFEFNYGGMGHGFDLKVFDGSKLSNTEKLNAAAMGVGANMAFRKSWFTIGGLFDPKLDVGTPSGGGGDVEMFHRVVANNYKIVYDPSVLVWHKHRADFKGLKKQVYMNGRSYYFYLTTVYRNKTVPGASVIQFMLFHWLWGWLMRNIIYQSHISVRLLLYEVKGLLHASIDLQGRHLQGRRGD